MPTLEWGKIWEIWNGAVIGSMITNIESWWEWGRNLQHFSLKWLCTCMSLQHNGWELASLLITHYWLSSSISVREFKYGTFTASDPIYNHGVIRFLCRGHNYLLPWRLSGSWGGGLRHLFWHQIWNLQGFLPLMWNFNQILFRYCRDITTYRGKSNVGMENLNLGILSGLMTSLCHQVRGIP